MSARRRSRRDEAGAVAILVAVLALVLFGIAALVVDLGMARDTRRQAQASADASALAAGNALYDASGVAQPAAAIAAARAYAAENFGTTAGDWAGCTDPGRPPGFTTIPGETACVSFKGMPAPTEVRVSIPAREVDTPFGSVLGVTGVEVGALAQARVDPGGMADCGLCIIGPGLHDFQNGDVTVTNADIHVNGTVANSPQSNITAVGGQINLQASQCTQPTCKGTFSPTPYNNQPAIADPLAFLTLPPDLTGLQPKTQVCGNGSNNGPGVYRSLGIPNGNGTCTLQPGLYVITEDNHYAGQRALVANGVTLYFTCQQSGTTTPTPRPCNPGESGGSLLVTGGGGLTITAPATGPTAGLSIVSDRNNVAEFGFRGNGASASSGTIYAASGTFDYRGNGNGAVLDSLVVVKDMDFSGAPSGARLTYTKEKNIQLPPGALSLSY